MKSWLGLANAYIDMGNWCGFTPFIGAGIGFATHHGRRPGRRTSTIPNSRALPSAPTRRRTNFAWAFYAGASYDVTPAVAIDLSYR